MGFSITYRTLFELSFLHGYFLNSGEEEYDSMTEQKKLKMKLKYNFSEFIEITPTEETEKLLRNHNIVYRKTGENLRFGIKVSESDVSEPFITLPLSTQLQFLVRIKDSYFENYTDLTLSNGQLFYFANVKPTDWVAPFTPIPLVTDAVFADDDFKLDIDQTTDITANLEDNEKRNLFGVIAITMAADDSSHDVLDTNGKLVAATPTFKIHFKNRKLTWIFKKPSAGFEAETNNQKPLTQYGFVEIDPLTDFDVGTPDVENYTYPNPTPKSVKNTGSTYYSEIFI